jgi:transposase-like protein
MKLNIKNLFSFLDSNPSEQDCINYLKEVIWKGKPPISPYDPTSEVYPCAKNRYRCKNTGKDFTARSITIFRNSNLSLKKWFLAITLFVSEGISSYQLRKRIEVSRKTAWFILHRLRKTSERPEFEIKLGNTVEIDEAFIGGKNKNRHKDKKVPNSQGRSWKDKTPTLVMVERGSNAIAQVVPDTKQQTLEQIIKSNVEKGSNVFTDEWTAYKDLGKWYNHQIVNHGKGQYANGKVSVNSAESFNACLKRTINGTYIHISKKHSQKYVDEVVMRYNTRNCSEKERFDLLLTSVVGKSLTYKELIGCY